MIGLRAVEGLIRVKLAMHPSRFRAPPRSPSKRRRRLAFFRPLPAALMLLLAAAALSAQPLPSPDRDPIRSVIAHGTLLQFRRPDFADLRQALDEYYRDAATRRSEPDQGAAAAAYGACGDQESTELKRGA